MKNEKYWIRLFLSLPLFLLVCCGSNTGETDKKPIKNDEVATEQVVHSSSSKCNADPVPFVVIEFFSNEGCHSCAESEPIINSLIKATKMQQPRPNVLVLSHHIAYSHDEWVDKYGLSICDSLHTRYCKQLKSQQYTPQIVFNGQLLGVPDPQFLQKNMSYFITKAASSGICFKRIKEDSSSITIKYQLSGFNSNQVVNVVLLESNIKSKVTAGDNAGKILEHENVVREYISIPVTGPSDEARIEIPKDCIRKNLSVAVMLQDISSLEILASDSE